MYYFCPLVIKQFSQFYFFQFQICKRTLSLQQTPNNSSVHEPVEERKRKKKSVNIFSMQNDPDFQFRLWLVSSKTYQTSAVQFRALKFSFTIKNLIPIRRMVAETALNMQVIHFRCTLGCVFELKLTSGHTEICLSLLYNGRYNNKKGN